MYYEVRITRRNIDFAERGNPNACPIACALQDAGYENYEVGDTAITFTNDGKYVSLCPLKSVVDFIANVDEGEEVEPGLFVWDDESRMASYLEDSLPILTPDDLELIDESELDLIRKTLGA